MATDLDDRPADAGSDSLNPGQKHIDDVFSDLTSREHQAKDGKSGDKGETSSTSKKSGSEGGGSGSSSSDTSAETSRLGKIKGLYNKGKDTKQRVRSRASKLLKKKWLVGVGIGGGGVGVMIVLLLLLVGAFKIPHLAENITSYQFARATAQMTNNSTRIISEKISVSSAKKAVYDQLEKKFGTQVGKVKDTWSKLDRFRPNKIISNFNASGEAAFEYKQVGSRQLLMGIRTGNTSFPIKQTGIIKGLVPGYKFAKNIKFATDVAPRLNSALKANNIGPIIRGKVASQIRTELGIGLIAWKVGQYKGASAEKARLLAERTAHEKISGNSKESLKTASLKETAGAAAEAEEKAVANDGKLKTAIYKNGGKLKDVTNSITAGLKESPFLTTVKFLNGFAAVAVPACIVYDGSLDQAAPTINQQMEAQQKSYYLVMSAADQQKDGVDGSAEATGAFNEKLGDINNSIPIQRGAGETVSTAGYTSAEAGAAGGSYSIADVFGVGFLDRILEPVCPAITDTKSMVGLAALSIGTLFIPGAGQAESVGAKAATSLVGKLAEKLAERILRKRGADTAATKALNVSSKLSDVVSNGVKSGIKIAAVTILAKIIVASKAGYTNNGLEQGNDFANMADAGGNIAGNEQVRRQFYGAPLDKDEAAVAASDAVAFVNEQNATKSTYQRYVALSNPQSLLSRFAVTTASTLSSIRMPNLLKQLGNLLDPTALFSSLFSHLNPQTVHASAAQDASMLNYGNIQFGFTRQEQALMKTTSYGLMANRQALEDSHQEGEVEDNYKECFTTKLGDLLSDGRIKVDDEGNVKKDNSLCSPKSLGYKNPTYGDLVFRWRVANSYDATLDQLQEAEEVTADPATADTTQETTFTAASYNIDHAVSYPNDKCLATEPAKTAATPDYPNGLRAECVERRSKQQASVILGNSGSPAFDIVGLQEISQPQQTALLANLPGYSMYPAQVPKFHGVAVAWDSSKFSQAGQGTLKTVNNSAESANLPWIALKAGTQTYYVISVHAPNNANGGSAAIRKKMADTIRAWAKTKDTANSVVLVMGDFNEQLGGAKNMCVALTQKAILQNTIDMAKSRSPAKPCPSKGTNNGIDHIYASPVTGLTATGWRHMANTATNISQSSDHQPTHVTLTYSTGGGSQFRIASINVLGTNHEGPSNDACKRAPARPVLTGDACDRYRSSVLARIVGGEQVGKPIDIFGAQEVTRAGLKNIKSALGSNWGSWPKTWKPRYSQDTIFWDTSKFTFVEGGGVAYPYFRSTSYAPWVKLQDGQGKTIYVYNAHPPANVAEYNRTLVFKGVKMTAPAVKRKVAAQEIANDIKQRTSDGSQAFITGDMNSRASLGKHDGGISGRSELPYCIFTTGTGIGNAYDLAKGNSGENCPTKKGFQIDQIYAKNTTKVAYFAEPKDGLIRQMTDHHNIAVADIGEDTSSKKAPAIAQKITKVLTIVEENMSYDHMKSTMPNILKMAKKYGYASNYTATTHPSLPNYLAIASGSTQGVKDDKTAAIHKLSGQTVFGQAITKGKTAKLYAQSMPRNCVLNDKSGKDYQTKHNPWAYFTAERSLCNKFDVPYAQFNRDVAGGTLPNVGMLVPDMCYDAHDCSEAKADKWFKARMDTIFSGPDWKSGNLVVVLTTDEDHHDANNHVLTVVMHPGLKGQVVSTALNHYSLSRFYSNVVGAQGLKNAKGAPSLSDAFGFSF